MKKSIIIILIIVVILVGALLYFLFNQKEDSIDTNPSVCVEEYKAYRPAASGPKPCCEGLEQMTLTKMTGDFFTCYDPQKNKPECKYQGLENEGWYSPEGNLILKYKCSLLEQ